MAELLVWPALVAYGEAALAYAGGLRAPAIGGRLAIWGVRLGWLAQTALIVVQALRADGFPWGTWAGALNLFVWLVVGAYLVWGCNARFRLLGLLVMPPAVALLLAAWAGGGTGTAGGVHSGVLLAAHVGLILAGLAGLTLTAGMAALYLWEERSLKRRDSRLFRFRVPPLDTLDRIAARAATVSLALLSGGIILGLARLRSGEFDAAMAVTLCLWLVVAVVLALRHEIGLRGRRAATVLTAVFALVVLVLPFAHFAS
jgi:ABC-type uncharacterized transport system permease subunit